MYKAIIQYDKKNSGEVEFFQDIKIPITPDKIDSLNIYLSDIKKDAIIYIRTICLAYDECNNFDFFVLHCDWVAN